MKIYLVRHGIAASPEISPERPLTAEGKQKIEKIALEVKKKSPVVSRIVHSDKLRTKETAKIMGKHLAPKIALEELQGMGPNDEIEMILEELSDGLMIVGHLPYLETLVQHLAPDDGPIQFGEGATTCLSSKDDHWKIEWSIGL